VLERVFPWPGKNQYPGLRQSETTIEGPCNNKAAQYAQVWSVRPMFSSTRLLGENVNFTGTEPPTSPTMVEDQLLQFTNRAKAACQTNYGNQLISLSMIAIF
jgi:hypothetical protein